MVTVNIEGNGRVTQSAAGNFVTLEAFPDPGWSFAGWVGISANGTRATIIADATTVVGARFVVPDTDHDGLDDLHDLCPSTRFGMQVDANGCAADELDVDGDGISDPNDLCPETPAGSPVNGQGCAAGQRDTDSDGVLDPFDQCPNTAAGAFVNGAGCAANQLDGDGDAITDDLDRCPGTPPGSVVGADGCPVMVIPTPNPICGNGIIETGEQCEPPGSGNCDANCHVVNNPPPPPESLAGTWSSTQFLLGNLEAPTFYTAPESYQLNAGGALTFAHFTISAAAISDALRGTATILNTTVAPGSATNLYRVQDVNGLPGVTLTSSLTIQSFTLAISGSMATWSFDLTLSYLVESPVADYTAQQHVVGQQTGTVSAGGSQITWTAVTGTSTLTSDIPGMPSEDPAPLTDFTLGSWSRNGG
jgi:hypothetical protein